MCKETKHSELKVASIWKAELVLGIIIHFDYNNYIYVNVFIFLNKTPLKSSHDLEIGAFHVVIML